MSALAITANGWERRKYKPCCPSRSRKTVAAIGACKLAPLRVSHSAAVHALDENLRCFGPHNPRVGQHAGTKFLAQLPPADRDLLVSFRCAFLDQTDPAQFLVIARKADLDRLDKQLAFELLQLPLRAESVPDFLSIVIGSIAVLTG